MARLFDDASSQYLSYASAVLSAVPISLACWFNTDNTAAEQELISICRSNADHWHSLRASGSIGGDPIRASTFDGGWNAAQTTTGYSANTWHHACGVWAAADSRSAYIDGGSKHTQTSSRTPTSLDLTYIGANEFSSSPTNYMSGSIAEVGIWNVALTDAEVAILAKGYSPLFVRPQSLVLYIPLIRDNDEDLIGGLSFTANGSPTVSAHPRVFYPSVPIYRMGATGEAPTEEEKILYSKLIRSNQIPIHQLQL